MLGRDPAAQFQPGAGQRAVAGQEFLLARLAGVGMLVPELRHGLGVEDVQHHQFNPAAGEPLRGLGDGSRRPGRPVQRQQDAPDPRW